MSESSQPAFKENLAGVALRGVALVAKFALLMTIGRLLPASELGVYGLFAATVSLTSLLLGLQFHKYSSREVARRELAERATVVWSHTRLLAVLTVAVPIVALGAAAGGAIPWTYAGWFVLVLITSHLALELQRVLVAASQPARGFVAGTLGTGLGAVPATILLWFWPAFQSMHTVFACWALFGLAGVFVGYVYARREGLFESGVVGDWSLVKEGLQQSLVFLPSAISLRLIDFGDRYVVQYFFGESQVGVYTLFGSIASVMTEVVTISVATAAYPLIMSAYHRRDQAAWRRAKKRITTSSLLLSMVLLPAFVGGIHVVIAIVSRADIAAELRAFYVLLGAGLLMNMTIPFQMPLHAAGHDRFVLIVHVAGCVLNLALNVVLVPRYNLVGAAWATFIAIAAMLIVKAIAHRRLLHGPLNA